MAIQILGLRDNPKNPKDKRTVFFSKNWRANTVNEIFSDIDNIIAKIPEYERWNLYFTVADCFEEGGRKLKEQHVIPFDIDNLAGTTTEEVMHQANLAAKTLCEVVGISYSQTGVLFSGNGVQLFVQIKAPILAEDYFDTMKAHYKVVSDRIQAKLVERGIAGNMDTSVFSKGRLMRLPNTENRKQGRPHRMSVILNGTMAPQDFYLDQLSGINTIEKPDQIKLDVIKRYPEPDAPAVLSGCNFLKYCTENATEVVEPQWYAAASIAMRLYKDVAKCKEIFHKMSEPHPKYDYYETELKADQALENSGPRTCANIETLWDGCKNCPHYGTQLVSPILIHGPDYIKSKDFGFREIKTGKNGQITEGKPAYNDLIKQFSKEYEYINLLGLKSMYIMDKTHWREYDDEEIKAWMNVKVLPSPSTSEMNEFLGRIKVHNLRTEDWTTASTEGYMNFANGVLCLATGEIEPHNQKFGFMHVLPYNYDPRATSPRWDKFMQDITRNNPSLIAVMEEFAGYAIYGGDCSAQKALMLVGEGSNGKSLWAETVAKVVGDKNFSSVFLNDLANDQMRAQLNGKLFNYSDEGSDIVRSEHILKTLVTGGFVSAKEVFKPAISFKNKAKLIILTNKLPSTKDTSDGFMRRFVVVPMEARFKGGMDNKNLRYELWDNELPGICNRFIEGFKRLQNNKFEFTQSTEIDGAVENLSREINYANRFLEEELTITGNKEDLEKYPDIYARYSSWCLSTGNRQNVDTVFFKDLRRCRSLDGLEFTRETIKGRKYGVVRGIKLITGDY